jgi:hypothetical protein
MAGLALGALAGCVTPALRLDSPALHAAAPKTIGASPEQAKSSWSVSVPYWSSDTVAEVQDPALSIRANLLKALADRYALALADGRAADLALEIETTRWDYRVVRPKLRPAEVAFVYGATLRLKDRHTEKVLAAGSCDIHQATPPVTEQALRDPELFRAALRDTAAFCTDDFRHHVLGL